MKVLIWGFGVIGARHAKNFSEAGAQVHVFSRRDVTEFPASKNPKQALEFSPDWVFITTETGEHFNNLKTLAELGYKGSVLIEKPLFHQAEKIPANNFKSIKVSYNLRLHPLVQKLKEALKDQKIISASAYVGSFLPDWRRSSKDYRQFYSAKKSQGGGALRDLSHELDLAVYLLGNFKSVYGHGGHFSNLEIDSDDVFSLIGETQNCRQILVHMNYLDRESTRFFRVQTHQHTYVLDLLKNTLQIDKEAPVAESSVNDTYLFLAKTILAGKEQLLTSAIEAEHIMALIEASEKSYEQGHRIPL